MESTGCGHLAVRSPSPLTEIDDPRLRGVRLWLKRDDLLHPEVPGNKWRKLHLNLREAHARGATTLLTFGGAYSNHIRAVAAAGRACGFATVGVIRGEERPPLNPTLEFAVKRGMRLTYLDRDAYRAKHTPEVVAALRDRFGDFHLLPEGGSNALAVRGCAPVAGEIGVDFDVLCCACGTGGTLAGVAAGLGPGRRALGFAVLKGGGFLADEVRRLQREAGTVTDNWSIDADHHFGGFAKYPPELRAFVADFENRHGIEPERVYVAKMLAGIYDLAARGRLRPGTRVVALITGPPDPRGTGTGEGRGTQGLDAHPSRLE
ncbi:pyridoxal-phosphate dependent enzyme [Nocardiopsis sp. N85]|uniref:1-aminocyclopropane-1-carboxylate deaminase/D-cysteine desulfhydrase n=1 Tax=Nocardiopsis sp. N85 TaxID=3029400 RepID=UPI00237F03F6|nr:pyridoxal-phosphate dependent enzyme [Nocardiopsis sp. N85]MDE3725031.1 pyridoxal-phosphate dependent enzyme [Nocardiopsis sp. N85]